nr:MAG TPA: hypothetical protein [Crassvirales sp.]DAW82122.1 MAG TPA: hypothetical protein [Crassvirales sp.]
MCNSPPPARNKQRVAGGGFIIKQDNTQSTRQHGTL